MLYLEVPEKKQKVVPPTALSYQNVTKTGVRDRQQPDEEQVSNPTSVSLASSVVELPIAVPVLPTTAPLYQNVEKTNSHNTQQPDAEQVTNSTSVTVASSVVEYPTAVQVLPTSTPNMPKC